MSPFSIHVFSDSSVTLLEFTVNVPRLEIPFQARADFLGVAIRVMAHRALFIEDFLAASRRGCGILGAASWGRLFCGLILCKGESTQPQCGNSHKNLDAFHALPQDIGDVTLLIFYI